MLIVKWPPRAQVVKVRAQQGLLPKNSTSKSPNTLIRTKTYVGLVAYCSSLVYFYCLLDIGAMDRRVLELRQVSLNHRLHQAPSFISPRERYVSSGII